MPLLYKCQTEAYAITLLIMPVATLALQLSQVPGSSTQGVRPSRRVYNL